MHRHHVFSEPWFGPITSRISGSLRSQLYSETVTARAAMFEPQAQCALRRTEQVYGRDRRGELAPTALDVNISRKRS